MKFFDRILDRMFFLAGVLLVCIMCCVCLEVFFREVLNRPLIWVTEITEVSMLYITFLGSAWLLREGGHVRVDLFIGRLKPKTEAWLGLFAALVGLSVSGVLTVSGFCLFWDYVEKGTYTPTAIEIPMAAIIGIIPVGMLMLTIQFLRNIALNVAGMFIEMQKKTA